MRSARDEMPLRTPEPEPTTATEVACPACGHRFVWPPRARCSRCSVDLTSPAATEIFELDRRWAALATERLARVRQLEATRPQELRPPEPPAHDRPGPARGHGRGSGVPALLGLAGAALLTAAAVVFTAVAWTTLPAGTKAVILVGATVLAAIAALRLHLQGTTTAAGALGVLAMTLAAIDVAGAHRIGVLDLGDFAIPLGLVAAGGVGWLLARGGIRWVASLGVVSLAAGLLGCSAVLSDVRGFAAPGVTLVGSAAATLLGATVPTWPAGRARRLAAILAGVGLAVSGLVSVVALGAGESPIAGSLAAIAVPVILALAATRLDRWAAAAAVLLLTAAAIATASALGVEGAALTAVAAALAAFVVWSLSVAPLHWRPPVLLGAAPVLVVASGAVLTAAATTVERLASVVGGEATPIPSLDPGTATAVLFTAIAVAAWRPARQWAVPSAAVTLVLLSAALPTAAAWIVLAAAATATVTADRFLDVDEAGLSALGCAVVAVGWSAPSSWSVAVAAAVVVAVAGHVIWHQVGWRALMATGFAVAGSGMAAAAAADAAGFADPIALGAGLAALLGVVSLVQWTRPRLAPPGAAVALLATAGVPTLAAEAPESGVLLLVAAVGWLAVAAAGRWAARWMSAVTASLGTAVLLADRGTEVVEAYTVVPALTLGVVGLLWLRRDATVRTITALWPALSVAVLPSLLALAAEPRALLRALLLAGVAGALASIGVALRWLAPILAGAIAGSGVALSQLAVVADVVPRWVTFAVVGALLVWLAATYERQQQRVQQLTGRLAGLR